jgi:GT2 family glycosyltransferase
LTEQCVESLRRWERVRWPIVVVDDGSPGGYAEQHAMAAQSGIEVVRHGVHQGVSAAWNTGARRSRTQWVVFLNNDVLVRGRWVERLTGPLRRGKAVVSGAARRRERGLDAGRLRTCCASRWFLEGWCLAMRVALWRTLGGFDEGFRVYFGDTDLQMRAQLFGALAAVEGLPLVHLGHRTAHDRRCLADRRECWRRDREWFLGKWTGNAEGQRTNCLRNDEIRMTKG